MPQNKKRILAIDPGTRHMGVALLDGDKLIYHAVKVIK
jgi:RNase H-fold protein (predicted Holliday junction resolvase)